MRILKIVGLAGLILAVTGTAGANTTLPPNAQFLEACTGLRFSMSIAGLEIDYGQVVDPVTQNVIAQGTGIAIGYIPDGLDPSGVGNSGGRFVMYTNVVGVPTVVADVDSFGVSSQPNPLAPGYIPNLAAVLANPQNVFTAYGVGQVDSLQQKGQAKCYPHVSPTGAGNSQQMTFTVNDLQLAIGSPSWETLPFPGSPGYVTNLPAYPNAPGGGLVTSFVPNTGLVHFVEDPSTDVDALSWTALMGAPALELPTGLMSGMTYYNPAATNGAWSFSEVGAGTGDNDGVIVALVHNTLNAPFQALGLDSFNADLRGPAGLSTGPVVVYPAGHPWAGFVYPAGHPLAGQPMAFWSGGATSFQDGGPSWAIVGGSWKDTVLDDTPFQINSNVRFGAHQTGIIDGTPGVLPEDPLTFTFQSPRGGGPEIFGGHVIPEPMTMIGVFMGVGGLGGYIWRKRRP
jgi:hypothetical protein